jgi:subtilisin family serine protease
MIRTVRVFLLGILIMLLSVPAWGGEIAGGLEEIMESTPGNQTISVLVYLNQQVNLDRMTDVLDGQKATLQERHETVVVALQEMAEATQGNLTSYLEGMVNEGIVEEYESYWITNAFKVRTNKEGIQRLVNHPDVEKVYYNYEIELIEPEQVKEDPPRPFTIETGVEAVRAPEVWALGYTGEGVLVANMDTGVDGHHPCLESRWVGVADPRYQGHPEWAWYDPWGGQNFPYDDHGHGTHTMGSVCGGAPGDSVGVAPGAYWMASAPIDRGGGIPRTVSDAILSFQWMVDPDGNPQTNWDVPQVCSNSWGLTTGHGYPPCDTLFWSYLDACEAAGTVILFSAGNEGSSGLRRPADRATDDYRTCAVAAVDANTSGWPIASFSSRGPTYCTPDGSAAIKPDISAPGVNVRSSYPGGGYTTMSGTSMASPHVNGVVALIRQANPNLSVELVKEIMYSTAYDLGPTGEDNSYGWGMVDAYEAVQMALSYLEGYGVIMGQVTDLVTGDGLPGTVTVTNRDPQIVARCNQTGNYTLYVPADTVWELRAEYTENYLPDFASLSVSPDDTVEQDFVLEPKVEVILKASFGNPDDIAYRTFYFRGSWDDDGFYNADWDCSFSPLRDDGVAPDEVQGDGVFTGSVMLATDLNNTYEWAVYSENYNDHDSRLQYGASFDITSPGNPPTVPTLVVNPSGNENNWTITLHDTNTGVEFDLTPGYNNQPYIWYGTVYIPGGLSADYIVKVMHSDVAGYGQGGVGGDPIHFTTTESGNYTFYFNDDNDLASTGASLIARPGWLEIDVEQDQTAEREISLINNGELDLNFRASETVDNYARRNNNLPEPEEFTSYVYEGPKVDASDGPSGEPVIDGSGGPDNFGHRWIDSDEMGGPAFSWVDISGYGNRISMSDDDNQGPFSLPFTFNFYGNDFNSFRICSNGFVSFTSTSNAYTNQSIPGNGPENALFGFWDDLNPSTGGDVYYYTSSDSAVISWHNVPHYYNSGSYTFQIVMLANGQMFFNYLDMNYDVNSCTIGIQNANRNDALQVVYNSNYVHDSLTVKISAGWLEVDPSSGVIPAGGSQPLTVTVDASNLETGDYTGHITVASWDDVRQLPNMEIPVTLHVVDNLTDLSLAMYPDETPVQVRRGGSFDYTMSLTNNTGGTINFDGWVMVQLPNSNMFGPIIQASSSIGAGATNYYYVTQDVPNIAPIGSYGYFSYVGDYPNTVIDEASFPFEIVRADAVGGNSQWNVNGFLSGSPGGMDTQVPTEFSLFQNYPNPFNAQSTIKYGLPEAGKVKLEVFNLLGQKVATLVDGYQNAGYHSVNWDASSYSSGIYFYKLAAGNRVFTRRMTLLK